MISIRAGYFAVGVTNTPECVTAICKGYAEHPPKAGSTFNVGEHTYSVTDPEWSEEYGIFTATMWRIRFRDLPSKLIGGRPEQVGGDLGESASVAYMPGRGEGLVQYSHSGPRHTIFSAFLESIGLAKPVALNPVIVKEAVERMKHAQIIRRLEFALGDIADEQPLRGAGLGEFIDQLKGLRGTSIRIEVSMGHNGGGLAEQARAAATALTQIVGGVKSVKVGIKEGEGRATEMLDLLGGRLFIDLNIPESGREIDRTACRERLRVALAERTITSEEESIDDDDDESTDGAAAAEPPREALASDEQLWAESPD